MSSPSEKAPLKKEPLNSLFRDHPRTPEGKYLVLRRDGSIFEHPSFVLGARDPRAAKTLRKYADFCEEDGLDPGFVASIRAWADRWDEYRKDHGDGDPEMGPHRRDCPAIIALMRLAMNG